MDQETKIIHENAGMAESYFAKYKPQMQAFENSLVAKSISLGEHHLVQLGKQLDQFGELVDFHEAQGSLNVLGELPKVGLDVITATMSNSVLPVIATTQAIEQQKSIIWFKQLKAVDTKGNLVAGETIVDPRTGRKTPKGYASNEVIGHEADAGDGTEKVFTFQLNGGESIRSQFLKVYLESDNTIMCKDYEGKGELHGKGCYASVNYDNATVVITFDEAPANDDKIFVDYQMNLEEMNDLPRMQSVLASTDIEAKSYALKGVMGMFQMFSIKKTLGDSALDDFAVELTREINSEIGGDFIGKYQAVAQGTTSFSLAVPNAVSEKQHREAYAFRMADAEAVIQGNAGRGMIKVMIVGREHAALVRGLDGFNVLSDGNSLGAHIFGTYKGITYIRVPEQALLDSKAGIGLYTGASQLESAGVYAPFMPLTVDRAPLGPNPLMNQMVAATMAGTKVVVPSYATKFNITA